MRIFMTCLGKWQVRPYLNPLIPFSRKDLIVLFPILLDAYSSPHPNLPPLRGGRDKKISFPPPFMGRCMGWTHRLQTFGDIGNTFCILMAAFLKRRQPCDGRKLPLCLNEL